MSRAALLLDVTRTVRSFRRATPSGIDRVERAYLDHAIRRGGALLCLIGRRHHVIPASQAPAFAAALDRPDAWLRLRGRFSFDRPLAFAAARAAVRRNSAGSAGTAGLAGLLSRHVEPGAPALNVGHDNLSPAVVAAFRSAGLEPVVLLHDTIPLDAPEFSRPRAPGRFRSKFAGAAAASRLLFTTRAARAAAEARAGELGFELPPASVLPLGVVPPARRRGEAGHPAFVCLGTIEGRKNHLLLLGIWRRFWDRRDPAGTPHLHIVGRRGWEAGQVFATLDRAPMMGRTVFEHAGLEDAEVARLVAGARALLFPSFIEGFGLPLAEALAAGVPVIAADIPALREVGGEVPDYVDPLDGPGWIAAIDAYAAEPSPRRAAQLARMAGWTPPSWEAHFAALDRLLARR